MENNLVMNIGSVVYSRAGRDKGRYYIVLRAEGEFIWTADGDLHKTDKPKKKKSKHVKDMSFHSEYVGGKLKNGEKVTNAELRRSIAEYEAGAALVRD